MTDSETGPQGPAPNSLNESKGSVRPGCGRAGSSRGREGRRRGRQVLLHSWLL